MVQGERKYVDCALCGQPIKMPVPALLKGDFVHPECQQSYEKYILPSRPAQKGTEAADSEARGHRLPDVPRNDRGHGVSR